MKQILRRLSCLSVLYGSFASITKEGWAQRNHPNVQFVFFEDMKANIDLELKKINDFIGAGLTREQLNNVSRLIRNCGH